MAEEQDGGRVKSKPPRPKPICFSFAAYTNNLLHTLKSSNVVIDKGLSDAEFSNLQSNFNFSFPPDLRAILQQGLPISTGFPNWRSSSSQQLQILLSLPTSSILRRVSKTRFWHPSWGPEPRDPTHALSRLLNEAPPLVPIYRHCYMPSSPNVSGNPVFYIDHDGDVRLLSFDVAGFFREFLCRQPEEPVWAATRARRIKFWSELAEARGGRWWWRVKGELGGCLEGVVWRLKEGGWREEEIREMMMVTVMDDYDNDEEEEEEKKQKCEVKDKESLAWHVRVLSSILLRAGWSREDVLYSLGVVAGEGKSWLEFHQPKPTVNINAL
ncbi:uncharacterized protein LOC113869720 [Abrus precatorius]|uniref:Uncharacterized protein LOC113869720 n=1 Tax=Abrus precatorius TaxID=3816 RepID=A0A8B8M236_ABRPR|nr:uncharacterized protein LOC113869720 [Abrus precatorius]